jgi:pimeloyl-ACP methyl ester carboxylesterase
MILYPEYELNLVGHSLGGAVAALAALDLQGHGFDPVVTTFGEPRVGNKGLVEFLDKRFNLTSTVELDEDDTKMRYRRVTHVNDPVPLLPLTEWSFAMHAGEIYISKSSLSPDISDLEHCVGDNDQECIAGADSTTSSTLDSTSSPQRRDLIASVKDEIHDVVHEPWGIPSRYKLWQLFFAHRDYFWRLGLCLPGGDPLGGGEKYDHEEELKMELR